MNFSYRIKNQKNSPSKFIPDLKILFLLLIFIFGCSSTKRYTSNTDIDFGSQTAIRVLLDNNSRELAISVNDEMSISDEKQLIAVVAKGNTLQLSNDLGKLILRIGDIEFIGNKFYLNPSDESEIIKIDEKKYRGRIIISNSDSEIRIVNQLGLEDYVKGVMIKEMPAGNGRENYNALKAFSICVRNYALSKITEEKDFFDIYSDTKDQVYGGVDGETEFTNDIVDETESEILFFENEPAIMFYHSTCAGYTEDVNNVFAKINISYLRGVKDGDEPFCKISPRYQWIENYSESTFIDRLYDANLIVSKKFQITDIEAKSRFKSGRVNELKITLNDFAKNEKTIIVSGNKIRSIIRTSDGKSILKSTSFDITLSEERNITITGKGNGHGVGLCQWGAIGQSKNGIDYTEILNHYFPGTKIKNMYD